MYSPIILIGVIKLWIGLLAARSEDGYEEDYSISESYEDSYEYSSENSGDKVFCQEHGDCNPGTHCDKDRNLCACAENKGSYPNCPFLAEPSDERIIIGVKRNDILRFHCTRSIDCKDGYCHKKEKICKCHHKHKRFPDCKRSSPNCEGYCGYGESARCKWKRRGNGIKCTHCGSGLILEGGKCIEQSPPSCDGYCGYGGTVRCKWKGRGNGIKCTHCGSGLILEGGKCIKQSPHSCEGYCGYGGFARCEWKGRGNGIKCIHCGPGLTLEGGKCVTPPICTFSGCPDVDCGWCEWKRVDEKKFDYGCRTSIIERREPSCPAQKGTGGRCWGSRVLVKQTETRC